MAAVLACQPSVASHWTAGWLWGLFKTNSSIHLTAASRRHRRKDFAVHYAPLTDEDVTEVVGIPVTSLARTVLDLTSLVEDERLARLLQRAEELEDEEGRRLFDLRKFESLHSRTDGHPGRARLSRALAVHRPELAVLRSNLERDFRDLIRASSLPLPSHNVFVGRYELDCYWERERFCVELDVYATHGLRRSFEADREREDDLLLEGIEVMRITDVRLGREPEAVMERLREHLARRRRTAAFN